MFYALKTNPSIIPILAYPSSVFFLLSLENFVRAVKEWLGYALESLSYDVNLNFFYYLDDIFISYRLAFSEIRQVVKNFMKK